MSVRAGRAADRLLTGIAVLGVLGILVALAGPLAGLRVTHVLTGSMEPAIAQGSLALVNRTPVAEVDPGDVVQVRTESGASITHRVVSREADALVLKGDANDAADPVPYRAVTVERVLLDVPWLGRLAAALGSGAGLLLLALVGLGLVVLVVRPDLVDRLSGHPPSDDLADDLAGEPHNPSRRPRRWGAAGRGSTAVLAALVMLLAPHPADRAWAAGWGDAAPATTSVAAYRVTPTVVSCGTLQILRATLTWAPRSDATSYVVHYGPGGALTETVGPGVTSKTFTLVGAGVFWVEVQHAYAGVTWTSVASNKVAYLVLLDAVGTCADVV